MTTLDEDFPDLEPSSDIERLLEIMARLRDPQSGCPWDREQTFESIVPFTIEEAYEVKDAIDRGDMADLCDELGDLLLQVVYYAQMAAEDGSFDFGDVVTAITKKMIRRHPHVFGSPEQRKLGMAPGTWERIKTAEREEKRAAKAGLSEATHEGASLLDSVPVGFPALTRALKLQEKASTVGFDWDNIDLVFDKMREEIAEFEEEIAAKEEDHRALEGELGDILFVAVNLARHLKLDPETALSKTNSKFFNRFRYIEDSLKVDLASASLSEMEKLWQEAKTKDEAIS